VFMAAARVRRDGEWPGNAGQQSAGLSPATWYTTGEEHDQQR
jgi:hypothetical protein